MSIEYAAVDFDQQYQDALFRRKDDSALPAEERSRVDGAVKVLRQSQDFYDSEVARITKVFVPEAREGEIAKIRDQVRERVDAGTIPVVKSLEQREAGLLARLNPEPIDLKEKVALVIETRARLRARFGDDLLLIMPLYLEACRTREPILVAAVETAPLWDRLVSPETLAKGLQIRQEVSAPDVVSALKATRRELDSLRSALRIVRRHCEIVVGGIRLLDS